MLEDSLEASLAEIVEEEVIMNEDSFFESKNSMKFENVKPMYDQRCEVYSKDSNG